MQREPRLDYQGQQGGNQDRARAEFVHLDVRFAHAQIKCTVHGLATGAGFEAAALSGFTATVSGSLRG